METKKQKLILPQLCSELTPIQQGWLLLSQNKVELTDALSKKELEVQALVLAGTQLQDLELVQVKLKDARDKHGELAEQRKNFTGMIKAKLTDPLMEFEKRTEAELEKLKAHELSVRQEVVKKNAAAEKYNSEVAAFKAHIANEHFRIAAAYRAAMLDYISNGYVQALSMGTKPGKDLQAYLLTIEGFMKSHKVEKFQKFERTLLGDKEAAEIFKGVTPYDPATDLKEALQSLKDKFAMYKEDAKNKEAAIASNTAQVTEAKQELDKQVQIETATNNLVASAGAVTIGGAVVKKSYECVEENTPEWAMSVISVFVKNWGAASKHLQVKTWANLSIKQMAAAIAKQYSTGKLNYSNELTFKATVK